MKKKLIQTARIILLLIIFLSCESIVNVDLTEPPSMIVANSFFTPDSIFKIHISKSLSILEDSNTVQNEFGYLQDLRIPIIKDAIIQLWNDKQLLTVFKYEENGYYIAPDYFPAENKNYKLIVNAPGFNPVTANDIIPTLVPISNIEENDIASENYYSPNTELTITFTDIPNVENYYQLTILNNYHSSTSYRFTFESNDVLIMKNNVLDEQQSSFTGDIAIFDDIIISGKEYNLKVRFHNQYDQFHEKYVVLTSISENLYKYLKSVNDQKEVKDNPFSEPVLIHNNIKNGIGIFAGYNSSFYKIK